MNVPTEKIIVNLSSDFASSSSCSKVPTTSQLILEKNETNATTTPLNRDLVEKKSKRKKNVPEDIIDVDAIQSLPRKRSRNSTFIQTIFRNFPDCDREHAKSVCVLFGVSPNDVTRRNVQQSNKIYSHMCENPYPMTRKSWEDDHGQVHNKSSTQSKYLFDYDSILWVTSAQYRRQAVQKLSYDFPFLKTDAIETLFQSKEYHYTPTFRDVIYALAPSVSGSESASSGLSIDEEKYKWKKELKEESKSIISVIANKKPLTVHQQESLTKLFESKSGRSLPCLEKPPRDDEIPEGLITETVLVNEITYIEQYRRELSAMSLTSLPKSSTLDPSTKMECQCCFMEFEVQEMCRCEKDHLFCCTCLRKYAEEEIFGKGKTVLKCMWQGKGVEDKCELGFNEKQLSKALSIKLRQKYDEAQFLDNLKKANIPDLCKCPKCSYQAILPADEFTFRCPQASCGFKSCRRCGEESHFPLACEEIEKQSETDHRTRVEEAMTKARVRECPKCKNRFYKVEGCNKMRCSCGTHICYICRKVVRDGYSHFAPGKCPLHTNTVQDDERAVQEAGLRERRKATDAHKGAATRENWLPAL